MRIWAILLKDLREVRMWLITAVIIEVITGLFIFLMTRGNDFQQISSFLILLPLPLLPLYFFMRGIIHIKKEWDRGTIQIYLQSDMSCWEFNAAEVAFMLAEVAVIYLTIEILFIVLNRLLHSAVIFYPTPGIIILFFPLYIMYYIFGYTVQLFTYTVRRGRKTLAFLCALFLFIAGMRLNSIIAPYISGDFHYTIRILERLQTRAVASSLFFIPIIFAIFLFVLDVLLYSRAEY